MVILDFCFNPALYLFWVVSTVVICFQTPKYQVVIVTKSSDNQFEQQDHKEGYQPSDRDTVMIIGVTRRGRRYAGFNREFQLQRKEVVEAHEVVH